MPFDVEMPDGTVIQGVPDGTTKAEIQAKYQAHVAGNEQPTPRASQALGFYEGLTKPFDNAARGLEYGANKLGLNTAAINDFIGLPSASDAAQAHKGYIASQEGAGTLPGGLGKFAGEVAGTLPLATLGPLAGGAVTGALLTDKDTPMGVAGDAGLGAVGGKIGDAAIRGVAKVVSPTVSKYAKALMDEGVRLTPGQILGGGLHKAEDKITSIPFLGDMVANARIRGLEDFNRAAINRSLAPISASLAPGLTGRDAVDAAHTALSNNYGKLLKGAFFKVDPTYTQNVTNLTTLAKNIPQYGSKPLQDFIDTNITPRLSNAGSMSGEAFKEVDSLLGQEAKSYRSSQNPNDRKLGDAFGQLQAELKDALGRANPGIRQGLKDTDAGYANLVRIENAAARGGGAKGVDPGVFTPAQLAAAVRATDGSVRKNAVARGNALMQDLSDAGISVLPAQVPDSGTPSRIAAMLLAGGAAGHVVSPFAAAPLLGGMAAYTQPGVRILETLLAKRPAQAKAIAKLLKDSSSGIGGIPGAMGAAGLSAQLSGNGQ